MRPATHWAWVIPISVLDISPRSARVRLTPLSDPCPGLRQRIACLVGEIQVLTDTLDGDRRHDVPIKADVICMNVQLAAARAVAAAYGCAT
jgi:hypothetical protein